MQVWPPPAPRPARRCAVAGVMALVWSVVVIAFGVLVAVAFPLIAAGDNGTYCESIDHPGPCSSPWPLVIPGLVVVALGVGSVVASVALLRGRGWARLAIIVWFSLWALVPLFAVANVAASLPEDPTRLVTPLAMLAYSTTIVVLAAQCGGVRPRPPVRDADPAARCRCELR